MSHLRIVLMGLLLFDDLFLVVLHQRDKYRCLGDLLSLSLRENTTDYPKVPRWELHLLISVNLEVASVLEGYLRKRARISGLLLFSLSF